MDFTKIKPVEYNGQRVACPGLLKDYLVKKLDLNRKAAEARINIARKELNLVDGIDFWFGASNEFFEDSFSNVNTFIYTKSGVLKLSEHRLLKVLKDFAAQYFDNATELPAVTTVADTEFAQVETPDVTDLVPVEWSAQRVLTTEQLAQFYQCHTDNIKVNFNANKEHFIEGKHYFKLEGEALKNFKSLVSETYLPINKFAPSLYLWTERGAARHAKMLSTDKAWAVFELLEDNYFNGAKTAEVPPANIKPTDLIKEIGETKDAILAVYTGAKVGIVLAQATNLVGEYYHRDLSSFLQLLPPADYDTGFLNPTEIGKILGISAQLVNVKLSNLQLQLKVGKDWRLTDEGKKYAEEKPYMRNGHSGYQIKWTDKVIPLLTEVYDLPTAEEMNEGLFAPLKEVTK